MTPDEINALPDRVRAYIHELEVTGDPSGDRRELIVLREQNQQLQRFIEEQRTKDEIDLLTKPKSHFVFVVEPHGRERWMAIGRNDEGDEVWCDGALMGSEGVAERIAANMQAAYNKGIEVAVRSQIQHGIKLLESGTPIRRGTISDTTTYGGWVVERKKE